MWSVRWRDTLDAYVSPGHVDLVGRRRAPPWAPLPAVTRRIERHAAEASLAERLVDAAADLPCRGAPVRVVLSNHYVRYASLALGTRLVTTGERELAARYALRDTFHDLADAWRVTLGDVGPETAVAAGVAPAVIDDLVGGFAAIGSRVAAIEPVLVRCINAVSAQAKATGPHWLVCQEPTRVVLALLDAHGIRLLRSHRARPADPAVVRHLLDQARLGEEADDDDAPVYVCRVGTTGEAQSGIGTDGWITVEVMDTGVPSP